MPQTEDGIPAIVKLCIHAIEHKGGLESVGIYRVSGIKSEIDRLRVVLQPPLLTFLPNPHDIHTLSFLASTLHLAGPI